MRKKVVFICGGQLAGMLYSMFHKEHDFIGYVDDVYERAYVEKVYGVKKLGTSNDLKKIKSECSNAVISVTNMAARKKYIRLLNDLGFDLVSLISKTSIIADNAKLGKGCVVQHNVIINPMAKIGDNCAVFNNSVIGHDNILGDNVYISPSVTTNGDVTIGNNSFIGTGAVIIPNVNVGENCTIGASSCVLKDVPDNSKVAGVPAKVTGTTE